MAEHLHGYPQCETPAGQPCGPSDLNYAECQAHGPLTSCAPSVVDGIPTGQYQCVHRDAQAAARPAARAKPKKKKAAKKAAKAKGKPKKKAAKKAAKKASKKARGKARKAGKKKKKK